MNELAKPFLKWAGGKSQLLEEIRKFYPFLKNKNITKYAEPFVGGGAVLFDVLNNYKLEQIYISDLNPELINSYLVIQNQIEDLLLVLDELSQTYLLASDKERREIYLKLREKFNKLQLDNLPNVEKAALMIFLNKTCFNGLYRVNKKGEFNVPIGSYKNPKIYEPENLRLVSQKLKNIQIVWTNYQNSLNFIDDQTFAYFDPPYRPLTNSSNFTAYNEADFNDQEQIKLANFIQELDRKGAKILLSNSDPKNSNPNDNFFDELYVKQKISRISAHRMINSKAEKRGKITELLIRNFDN